MATLAQAMSSTNATAPRSTSRAVRDVADHLFVQRNSGGTPAFVVFGVLLLEARGDGGEVGFCLVDCDLRLETRDDLVVVIAADGAVGVGPTEGNPGFGEIGHAEFFGHDADDGVALRIDGDVAADDAGVGGETIAPELVAEENGARVGVVVVGE